MLTWFFDASVGTALCALAGGLHALLREDRYGCGRPEVVGWEGDPWWIISSRVLEKLKTKVNLYIRERGF